MGVAAEGRQERGNGEGARVRALLAEDDEVNAPPRDAPARIGRGASQHSLMGKHGAPTRRMAKGQSFAYALERACA